MRLKLRAALQSATLDLGNGVRMMGTQHSRVPEGINEWRIYGPRSLGMGYVAVDFYKDIPYPSINSIEVRPQKEGWGSKVIRALVDYYGGLTSDPQANTSDAAVAMWKSLGAERVPTDKCEKGYYYQLVKNA